MEATAEEIQTNNKTTTNAPDFYHTFEQGAGRLQVDGAIRAQSLVSPGSIRFGKFTEENHLHTVRLLVENTGNEKQRYSFRMPNQVDGLKWRFPLSFTLEPKQSKEVAVELEVDPQIFTEKIHDGFLKLAAGAATIHIPYLYVLDEPGYPRIMGFDFGPGDKPGTYRYEVYVPGGAEEFGIALFDPEDYRFLGYLDSSDNLKKGMIRKEFTPDELPSPGLYRAKVFARKSGREDFIETMIYIEKSVE